MENSKEFKSMTSQILECVWKSSKNICGINSQTNILKTEPIIELKFEAIHS